MLPRHLPAARHLRLSCALALLATLLTPALPTAGSAGVVAEVTGLAARALAQDTGALATLETRQPVVEWSPASATDWQTVATRQTVSTGDRVRTGTGASARLVYFEGTVSELSADTGVLVQRLERSPDGNIVTRLFQSAGTTLNRVVQLVNPAASFEVETPAATAFVRGTTPQVTVGGDGTTRVANVPDNTGGTVRVQGKDDAATEVILQPGEETQIRPGQAPSSPSPISQQPGLPQDTLLPSQPDQQQQMQQASAMMAGQGIAAGFAAQSAAAMNAAAAQALQNQFLNQLASAPNFGFSNNIPVATGTVRLR
jgi:hypothetical protein